MLRRSVIVILVAGCAPPVAAPAARVAAPASGAAPTARACAAATGGTVVATPAAPVRGDAVWVRHFGGSGSTQGTAVAVAADGTVLLAGQFSKGLTIGNEHYESAGNEDVFVAALASDGTPLWSRSFGGPGHDYASGVAVDASGSIYLTGFFLDSITFGQTTLRSAGVHDIFLAKLSRDGALEWSRRWGDAADQVSLRVFPDASGHVVAAGYARGTVRFGKRAHSSYPDKATFFARLDADGNALWSLGFGHIYDYATPAAVTNTAGHVFFSAGSDAPGAHRPRQTDLGLVLGEIDDGGKVAWQKRIGGGGANMETSIGLEPNGDIVTAGSFGGHLDFVGGELRADSLSALFVARLDAKGGHVWSRRFGGTQSQSIAEARVAPDGGIFVAGQFSRGTLDLATHRLEGQGSENGFVARLSGDGSVDWARCFCANNLAWLAGVALDAAARPVVAGSFAGELDAGSGQVASYGGEDAIVAKLRP